MNILIVIYEFPPAGGGAGKAVMNFCKVLNNCNYSIDIVTSRSDKYEYFLMSSTNVYSVPIKRKGIHETGPFGMLEFIIRAFFKIKLLQKKIKYDLIHYYFSIPTGVLSLFLNKKIPYIVSLRGGDVPGYNPGEFQIAHRLLLPINKLIWKNARCVIALSDDLGKKAKKNYKNLEYSVIYNGVDCEIFYPEKNKQKTRDATTLISVSRLVQWKGLDFLLSAMSKLKDFNCELLIIGTGTYEYKLKEKRDALNLHGVVRFIGPVKHEELRNWYNSADIFVLPSLGDSFGQVFCEAMACGLPIIAASCGGVPEFVENDRNGYLVTPRNTNELVEKIKFLIINKKKRKEISILNALKMKNYFSWKTVCEDYLKTYNQVINKKQG